VIINRNVGPTPTELRYNGGKQIRGKSFEERKKSFPKIPVLALP
jgi:hypothetical protein